MAAGSAGRRGAPRSDRHIEYRIRNIAPVWLQHGDLIRPAAEKYSVPAELILAVIVEESEGKPTAISRYPGYVSDHATPSKISVGLGQMLISTARAIAPEHRASIDRAWLMRPANAIDLIARYLDLQYRQTGFDPPLAAAAYNAGSIPVAPAAANRWRLGNAPYVERFVAVFNAAQSHLTAMPDRPAQSFAAIFAGHAEQPALSLVRRDTTSP